MNLCVIFVPHHYFMDYKGILNRTYRIISTPSSYWQEVVSNEDTKVKEDFNYFYSLLVFCMACTLIGSYIYATDNRIVTAILRSLLSGVAIYGGFWANYYILTEILNKRFNIYNKKRQNFRLVIYSMTLSILINALVAVFPGLFFLKIINIYTLYIVWEGVGIMTRIDETNRTNFVLLLSISIIIIPIVIFQLLILAIPAAN